MSLKMADDGSLQERILRSLESILDHDYELKSFCLVPKEENLENKSPILYEDHHVALESWCVKHVYRYAYAELLEVRPHMRKKKLPLAVSESLNYKLIGVLLINPDVTTFWAMKRELVESDVLNIEKELAFSKLVLSYKGKSAETFSYRRWLMKRLWNKIQDVEEIKRLFITEMSISEMAACSQQNNYHAWSHRIWCVDNFLKKLPVSLCIPMLLQEVEFSSKWIELHVSEHSGYHYRQYVIQLFKQRHEYFYFKDYFVKVIKHLEVINDDDPIGFLNYMMGKAKVNKTENSYRWLNYLTLLLYELIFNIKKINTLFPDHESLWYHRRFLVYQLVLSYYEYHNLKQNKNVQKINSNATDVQSNVMCDVESFSFSETGEKKPKIFKSQPLIDIESSRLFEFLMKTEQTFIFSNSGSCSSLLQAEYAKRHQKWIRIILGFKTF